MQQWPEHSLYGYLGRLPTYKLEILLDARHSDGADTILLPNDYDRIERILRERPDSRLFEGNAYDRK